MITDDTIGKIQAAIGSFKERRKKSNDDKLAAKKADMVGYFIYQNLLNKLFDVRNQVFHVVKSRGSKRRRNSTLINMV
jgi:hypothetical protein